MLEQLDLGATLVRVIDRCETQCVAACCGLDAFDFDESSMAIQVASILLEYEAEAQDSFLASLENDLASLESSSQSLVPDNSGRICSITRLNAFFTRKSFKDFIALVRRAAVTSVRVVEFSRTLE